MSLREGAALLAHHTPGESTLWWPWPLGVGLSLTKGHKMEAFLSSTSSWNSSRERPVFFNGSQAGHPFLSVKALPGKLTWEWHAPRTCLGAELNVGSYYFLIVNILTYSTCHFHLLFWCSFLILNTLCKTFTLFCDIFSWFSPRARKLN